MVDIPGIHEDRCREIRRLATRTLVCFIEDVQQFRMRVEQRLVEVLGDRFTVILQCRNCGTNDGPLSFCQHDYPSTVLSQT